MISAVADTNGWLRTVDPFSPLFDSANQAIETLIAKANLFILPQNMVEFWAVATRALEANGLGWTPERAAERVETLLQSHMMLEETPVLFRNWLNLVKEHRISGKRVHDARIAAAVQTLRIDWLVTFNEADFRGWNIEVISPEKAPGFLSHARD